ncbi:MAG: glycosyltransferase family 4 protein [Candidatus Solibacter sp.]|jgi:glycosyltransferase involved in cell wall biosynthesis
MNVWVVAIAEPIGFPTGEARLLRAGTLANYLLEAGHRVCWWNSTFDHAAKRHIRPGDDRIAVSGDYAIRLLHACGYPKNICVRRLVDHYVIARKFARLIESEPQPDVIVCSLPTIELSLECVRYGMRRHVPVILDIRDLWPDVFLSAAPAFLKAPARLAMRPLFGWTRESLAGATALSAVSEGYLQWGLRLAGRERRHTDGVFVHGYDASYERVSPSERAAILRGRNINPSRIIVWFVGTLGSSYDLAPVIEAARRLRCEGNNRAHFVFSGDGPNRTKWQRLASGLGNVTFTGWIDRHEIRRFMAAADIGLASYSPDASQGLPFKLFEYMAGGIPVLSSLQGEAADFLHSNRCGLSYQAGSADSFSSALTLLVFNERLRRELGRNGLASFGRSYSAERIYPAMVNWIEQVAKTREQNPQCCR